MNTGILNDNEQEITGLYNINTEMRNISTVNGEQAQGTINGNKILRTRLNQVSFNSVFSYSTIYDWVGSNKQIEWNNSEHNSKTITWPSYSYYTTDTISETSIEWRMLEGDFYLSDEEIDLIKSKKVQPVLGISYEDDFDTIIPFNDLMNIFIDGELTHLNYSSGKYQHDYTYRIGNSVTNRDANKYINSQINDNRKYCNSEVHNTLSSFLNNKHIDLNCLNEKSSNLNNAYCKMYGDISQYIIKKNKNTYKIQVLIGQLIRAGQGSQDAYGGIGKIDLFLIKNPQFQVNVKPYIIENNEKVYTGPDYKFSYNEKIKYDIEIINNSDDYDFKNMSLKLNFLGEKGNPISTLNINKDSIIYNKKNIENSTELYINESKIPGDLSDLSLLKKGEKITISSDDINYIVNEYDGLVERANYSYTTEFNYLKDNFFYKYYDKGSIAIKPLKGVLNITVKSNDNSNEEFYIKVSSKTNGANIRVKNNETYTIDNLDYNTEYKVSLLNSSSHKSTSPISVTLIRSTNNNMKNITINTSSKSHSYFTQRKIDEMIINR